MEKTSWGCFFLFLPFETLVDLGAGDLVPEPLEPGDLACPVGDLLEDGETGQARLPLPSTHFPADGLQPDRQNLCSDLKGPFNKIRLAECL